MGHCFQKRNRCIIKPTDLSQCPAFKSLWKLDAEVKISCIFIYDPVRTKRVKIMWLYISTPIPKAYYGLLVVWKLLSFICKKNKKKSGSEHETLSWTRQLQKNQGVPIQGQGGPTDRVTWYRDPFLYFIHFWVHFHSLELDIQKTFLYKNFHFFVF